ncbi:hypothetical protein D7X99_07975 [Corallococcus sp. AB032C]|uniref:DUF6603 domain-containing protein n=1 Tax=Corallococcus TaxID=83461 RepID=UPI000ED52563|nr:DUF6603 domain-containing protein [Corallococcus sp. AB032C]NPC52599.1 hypothetical protein [Corallococcus exiguus]RKH84783.1 hypothetical protein D7X99_07975 [Corallococcus sp. AB032C]
MSQDASGTLELLATELARIFRPLALRAEAGTADSVLEWLGLRRPPGLSQTDDLSAAVSSLMTAATDLPTLVEQLVDAIGAEDPVAVEATGRALVERIGLLVQASRTTATALGALSTSAATLTPAQRAELAAFATAFASKLFQRLLVDYMEDRFPQLAIPLLATGAMEIEQVESGPPGTLQGAYTRKALHFDRMARLFTDPVGLLRDVHKWGAPDFDGLALFGALQALLETQFGIPAQLLQPPGQPAMLEAFAFSAEVNPALSPPGLDLSVRVPGALSRSETATAGDWQLSLDAQVQSPQDFTLTLRPLFDLSVDDPGTVDVHTALSFTRAPGADPFLLLGEAGGSRLEVQGPQATVSVDVHVDAASGPVTVDPGIAVMLHAGKLVISGEGGDGFLSTLLSGRTLESNFDVGMSWSPSKGVAFTGSAALEVALPAHVSLGPLEIFNLYLVATLRSDGAIPVELSAGFMATLGPLTVSVDRMGLLATFTFPDGGGNLGPADLAFAFKPPDGLGLVVDAGMVKGGGALFFDPARGEYSGALELVFADLFGVNAIGLITTQNPDGTPGFSLLILLTADFGSGIQLGLGFTLLRVGGLLGLNRTMNLEALMEGVRSGAIDSVMFPQDVVANAPRILSDLRTLFPQKQGTLLVGPMVELAWGTPALLRVSLGVFVEIPGDVAILGVLKVALPHEDLPLLVLQANFAGAIEFDKQRLYFFASLFESRILYVTLEGQMGVLVAYGDDGNVVVSVGGFHPSYTPPPLPFPTPQRVAVTLINTSTARVQIQGYFAVTPNTVQFGARADLFFGVDSAKVQGQITFDALFQRSPFFFTIDISATFSISVAGLDLLSARLTGSLEGPNPYRAKGSASISMLFFDISVDVEVVWGGSEDTLLPPILLLPLLLAELNKVDSWRALPPSGKSLRVSLRTLPPEDGLVLHPVGVLRVSQRLAPLALTLDRVGAQTPADVNRVELSVASGGLAKTADALESFAPAQFQDMTDADKLSRPAFAPEPGGVELSGAGQVLSSSRMVKRVVRYELIILDSNSKRFARKFFDYTARLFTFFLRGSSTARSALSQATRTQLRPFADTITVQAETYTVAFQLDNRAVSTESASFQSEASARDWMARKVALDPSLADQVHVIPTFEKAV